MDGDTAATNDVDYEEQAKIEAAVGQMLSKNPEDITQTDLNAVTPEYRGPEQDTEAGRNMTDRLGITMPEEPAPRRESVEDNLVRPNASPNPNASPEATARGGKDPEGAPLTPPTEEELRVERDRILKQRGRASTILNSQDTDTGGVAKRRLLGN